MQGHRLQQTVPLQPHMHTLQLRVCIHTHSHLQICNSRLANGRAPLSMTHVVSTSSSRLRPLHAWSLETMHVCVCSAGEGCPEETAAAAEALADCSALLGCGLYERCDCHQSRETRLLGSKQPSFTNLPAEPMHVTKAALGCGPGAPAVAGQLLLAKAALAGLL